MSFKSVYRSLQEVFPQVDLRILKAVAIEHSTDVDAAVEFILLEVLPSLSALQEGSCNHHDAREENFQSPEVERSSLSMSSSSANSSLHSYPGQPGEKPPGTDNIGAALPSTSLRQEEAICDGPLVGFVPESEKNVFPLVHQKLLNEAIVSKPSETMSQTHENAFVIDTTNGDFSILRSGESVANDLFSVNRDGNSSDQSWVHGEVEEPIQLGGSHLKPCAGSTTLSGLIQCEELVDCSHPLQADIQCSFVLDVPSAVSKTSQSFCVSSFEENLRSVQFGLAAEEALSTSCNESGEEPIHSVDISAALLDLDIVNTIDNEHLATPISTRSGQAVSIDFLEDFVTDCKGIKTTLVSAMESIVDMMKEVDLREKEANLAKEAASKADLDILVKVEDLKEMLKHAKEANSMHAGEVYGEKSILATEARELQSRLLSLCNERDKSLAIIEEIHQTLKVCLDTAEEERIKAEEEKLEKEYIARKAVAEQEDIMERVVQESKKLQQEAEENSKLREFLMERGRLVDMLQGEISVICEDVLGLKERVDGRVPLGRSLSSALILSSLASLTSSRTSTSSGKISCPVESSENVRTESQEVFKTHQLVGNAKGGEKSVVLEADRKAISDDDWEYFDGEADLSH